MAKLSVENKAEEIYKITAFVDKISRENTLDPVVAFDINIILEELITNIIFYAYTDSMLHIIEINIDVKQDEIIIQMADDGIEFNPLNYVPVAVTNLSVQDKPVGGKGLLIVRQKVDQIEYRREGSKNILSLVRKINYNGV